MAASMLPGLLVAPTTKTLFLWRRRTQRDERNVTTRTSGPSAAVPRLQWWLPRDAAALWHAPLANALHLSQQLVHHVVHHVAAGPG